MDPIVNELSIRCGVHRVRQTAMYATTRRNMLEEGDITVVAVSTSRRKEDVIEAYSANQRHFGENYVSELVKKATDPEVLAYCTDIKWHFIGCLESGKVNRLMTAPNLYMIQTIESIKLADQVNAAWGNLKKPNRLKVMIQVNGNEDPDKSGCSPKESHELAKHIRENCRHLEFHGLMTIGSPHDEDSGPNPDFRALMGIKYVMCDEFNIDRFYLKLSMGMSRDYEHAIEMGSNYVLIGTAIFGKKDKKEKKYVEV